MLLYLKCCCTYNVVVGTYNVVVVGTCNVVQGTCNVVQGTFNVVVPLMLLYLHIVVPYFLSYSYCLCYLSPFSFSVSAPIYIVCLLCLLLESLVSFLQRS